MSGKIWEDLGRSGKIWEDLRTMANFVLRKELAEFWEELRNSEMTKPRRLGNDVE